MYHAQDAVPVLGGMALGAQVGPLDKVGGSGGGAWAGLFQKPYMSPAVPAAWTGGEGGEAAEGMGGFQCMGWAALAEWSGARVLSWGAAVTQSKSLRTRSRAAQEQVGVEWSDHGHRRGAWALQGSGAGGGLLPVHYVGLPASAQTVGSGRFQCTYDGTAERWPWGRPAGSWAQVNGTDPAYEEVTGL